MKSIFFAGLLVGTLDILAAFVDYYITTGNGPAGVLRYIASGAFGDDAFTGSNYMVWWGLLFHYLIALALTIFFFWLNSRVKFISEYPVTTAILYGIFMWIVTVQVIVPLSNAHQIPFAFWKAIKAVVILILVIGLPLSSIAKRRSISIKRHNGY